MKGEVCVCTSHTDAVTSISRRAISPSQLAGVLIELSHEVEVPLYLERHRLEPLEKLLHHTLDG
jgi:hypothetical protein